MKLRALILLFGLIAYVGEWLSMPAAMAMPPEKTCCAEAANSPAHPTCPKQTKESKSTESCCLSCPMCYTAILVQDHELTRFAEQAKRTYPFVESNAVYGYHSDTWKPPNRA